MAIHSPHASFKPRLRVYETPLFFSFLIKRIRLSRCAKRSINAAVLSVEQSSITRSSNWGYVCAITEDIACSIVFSELYAAIIILINPNFSSINLSFRTPNAFYRLLLDKSAWFRQSRKTSHHCLAIDSSFAVAAACPPSIGSHLTAVVFPSRTPSVLSGINRIFTVIIMIFRSFAID